MTTALETLLQRARAGEEPARGELYERYVAAVRARVRHGKRRRNWFWLEEEEDVVQEVFARFFSALDEGKYAHRDEDGLLGFLTRTGFFVIMELKGKLRAKEKLGVSPERIAALDLREVGRTLPMQLAERDCLARLYAAIEDLPAARAEVLKGWLYGSSVADLATRMGRSANAVSGLKFQGLKQLRSRLTDSGFLEECGEVFGLRHG